jgi:IPTL-CTERM motif
MENEMNFKRVMMILLAALLLPGLALAQTTTRATFNVQKDFSDDNTASVSVTLDCFTGLPLTQSQSISESNDVTFVVESFEDGALDCSVSENDVTGYTASYDGCEYDDVADGDENECDITNDPDPVEVTVYKDWVVDGQGGNALDPTYSLTLWCDNEISGGVDCGNKNGYYNECYYAGPNDWYYVLTEHGPGNTHDAEFTADVIPDWVDGTYCWVEEDVYDSAVEVDDSDCTSEGLDVELAGAGDNECTIVNTVFYEGIPTLSQYGMAIMALLMLGVGFVGFRRFV